MVQRNKKGQENTGKQRNRKQKRAKIWVWEQNVEREGWKTHSNRTAGVFLQDFQAHVSLSVFHRMWASDFNLVPVLEIKGDRSYPQSIRLFSSNSSLLVSAESNVAETVWRSSLKNLTLPHNLALPPSFGSSSSLLFHRMKHVIWNKPHRGRLHREHVCVECILGFPSVCGCV